MHERSPKSNAIDTLLYERDMLRHCAQTVTAKRKYADLTHAEADRAEYYLSIEGFLLHFRNLLGFLINRGSYKTDLTIGRPTSWTINGEPVEAARYSDLIKRAAEINEQHGTQDSKGEPVDAYQKISWFLQHCTTYRHTLPRSWDIETMYAEIAPCAG